MHSNLYDLNFPPSGYFKGVCKPYPMFYGLDLEKWRLGEGENSEVFEHILQLAANKKVSDLVNSLLSARRSPRTSRKLIQIPLRIADLNISHGSAGKVGMNSNNCNSTFKIATTDASMQEIDFGLFSLCSLSLFRLSWFSGTRPRGVKGPPLKDTPTTGRF